MYQGGDGHSKCLCAESDSQGPCLLDFNMKICAISDQHGYLPNISKCDIFIIGGDICPVNNHKIKFQREWLLREFNPWIKNIDAKYKFIVFGNHDFIGQEQPDIKYSLNCVVLYHEVIEIEGIKIWGSPWTRKFFDWAFNMSAKDLYKLHKNIPKCDIIVTHGPPYGFGDIVNRSIKKDGIVIKRWQTNAGSPGLIRNILQNEPKLVIGGHLHSGNGVRKLGNTTIANVSIVNEAYKLCYNPFEYEI